MKLLLTRVLIFFSPFIIWVAMLEIFSLNCSNTFKTKADYLKGELENIEVLILGSSHNQWAINPEYIKLKTANIAFGGQDVQLDSALFFSYIEKMTRLKHVILELDYHTLEQRNDDEYFRSPWYYKYYGVELRPLHFFKKISLYYSSPGFFNSYFISTLDPSREKAVVNKYGFVMNESRGAFYDFKYDSVRILETVRERAWWDYPSAKNYFFNKRKMNSIISYCDKNFIHSLILSTPAFKSYGSTHVAEKETRRKNYIDSLFSHSSARYFDFESTAEFKITDFQDDDHLNSEGAKKFTLMVNNLLN